MQGEDTKTIAARKGKLLLCAIGCMPFTVVGVMMLVSKAGDLGGSPPDPDLLHDLAVALGSVLFFGGGAAFCIRGVLDRRPGLVLTSSGIQDGVHGTGFGFVPWSDITGIATFKAGGQSHLVLGVAAPEKYLRPGNWLMRLMKRLNHKTLGSPVSINATMLKIRLDALEASVRGYLLKYGRTARAADVALPVHGSRHFPANPSVVQRQRNID